MTGLNGVSHSYTLHTALTTIKWIVRAIAEQCCLGFISSCLKFKLQNGWMVVRTVISVMIYHHSNGLMVLFFKILIIDCIDQPKESHKHSMWIEITKLIRSKAFVQSMCQSHGDLQYTKNALDMWMLWKAIE